MSTPDLQTQINALAARLAVLDGQGLQTPAVSFVTQTNAAIAGIQEDQRQSTLTLEGMLATLTSKVNSLWTSIATYLGIPQQPGGTPVTVVPPPGPQQ
jgi:hypothetical protein